MKSYFSSLFVLCNFRSIETNVVDFATISLSKRNFVIFHFFCFFISNSIQFFIGKQTKNANNNVNGKREKKELADAKQSNVCSREWYAMTTATTIHCFHRVRRRWLMMLSSTKKKKKQKKKQNVGERAIQKNCDENELHDSVIFLHFFARVFNSLQSPTLHLHHRNWLNSQKRQRKPRENLCNSFESWRSGWILIKRPNDACSIACRIAFKNVLDEEMFLVRLETGLAVIDPIVLIVRFRLFHRISISKVRKLHCN